MPTSGFKACVRTPCLSTVDPWHRLGNTAPTSDELRLENQDDFSNFSDFDVEIA